MLRLQSQYWCFMHETQAKIGKAKRENFTVFCTYHICNWLIEVVQTIH